VLKYKANTLNHLTQTLNEWVSNCCLTPSGQFNFQLFHDVNKLYFDKDDDVCFTEKQQMHVPISLSLVSGLGSRTHDRPYSSTHANHYITKAVSPFWRCW
jgi:hypothetical protein